jgi:hypothetical protein
MRIIIGLDAHFYANSLTAGLFCTPDKQKNLSKRLGWPTMAM